MKPNQVKPIQSLPPSPRRSERVFRPAERYLGIISEKVEEIFLVGNGAQGDDPRTYNEAISDINSEKWLEAMQSEIDAEVMKHRLAVDPKYRSVKEKIRNHTQRDRKQLQKK